MKTSTIALSLFLAAACAVGGCAAKNQSRMEYLGYWDAFGVPPSPGTHFTGVWNTWDKNGNLLSKTEYFNGVRNGTVWWYDQAGKVTFTSTYRDGQPWEGICAIYDRDNEKIIWDRFVAGKMTDMADDPDKLVRDEKNLAAAPANDHGKI